MDRYTEYVKQSLTRGEGWFVANPSYLSAEPVEVARALSAHLATLQGVNLRLTDYIAQHETSAAKTLLIAQDERDQRRDLLTHHLATIVKTARALRGVVPGIGVLQMPKGNVPTPALITAADVMVRKAEIYQSVLVENGLPVDFRQQLTDAAARLKGSLDARGLARAAQRAAVEGISTEVAFGRRVVELMDSALKRVLRREPVKWAEWRHAIRVRRAGYVPKEGATRAEGQAASAGATPTIVGATSVAAGMAPIVAGTVPIAAGAAPIAAGVVPIGAGAPSTLTVASPTLVATSPTEVVGSPTVREKAA